MKLIVNADDFGASKLINNGIVHGFGKGIITSASILANGKAFHHAIKLAKSHKIPVGVHLNLTTYKPLTRGNQSITHNGSFSNNIFLKSLFYSLKKEEIYRELKAQILKVKDTGIEITHLDGHRHIQIFPQIREVIAELAVEFNIRAIRLPKPKITNYFILFGRQLPKYILVMPLVSSTKKIYDQYKIKYPNSFFGFFETGKLSLKNLIKIINSLNSGINEIMSHPGYLDYSVKDFLTYSRQNELNALTNQKIIRIIKEKNILLTSFKSLS